MMRHNHCRKVVSHLEEALMTKWLSRICVSAIALATAVAHGEVRIENYEDGETIRFPVPLLRGVGPKDATTVTVTRAGEKKPYQGLIHNGRFKVLCELNAGDNQLVVRIGDEEKSLRLKYQPQTNSYIVRAIYATDNTGDTAYQSPSEDTSDYRQRLATAMQLMQTMTAERMHDLGYGRRTFRLERDDQGKIRVHKHLGQRPASHYYALPDGRWYQVMSIEVGKSFPTHRAKNVVIAAYTRHIDGVTKGHTALGGGGQGLFGSGNFFTWPASIRTAQQAFMDATPIDKQRFMDDSIFRSTYWAAASTTIGATLHEMGHTFGLPHTNHPHDIMTRGFDRFNRVFTVIEPKHNGRPSPYEFKDDEIAMFAPVSAAQLVTSPWLAMDDRQAPNDRRIELEIDEAGGKIRASAAAGVAYLGLVGGGDMRWFKAPNPGDDIPKELEAKIKDLPAKWWKEGSRVVAIDAFGRRASRPVKKR